MYELNQVMNGIIKYIDAELLSKTTALNQFLGGMAIGKIRGNAVNIFNQYKETSMFKMLNIVDENDKINVDELIILANEQMDKKALTVDLPIFGIVTFNKDDISKLSNYIRG